MFVVKIQGGLGNQLFQYNFAKYLKDKYPNEKINLDTSYFKKDSIHGGYMLCNPIFKINNHAVKKTKKIVNDEEYKNFNDLNKNVFFEGYWQNLAFFDKVYITTEDLFSEEPNINNKQWLSKIKASQNSVSIHIRCGDYNNHFLMGNIATKSYFNHAIDEVLKDIENPVFFIFSDDLEWAKTNLDFKGKSVNLVTGNEKPEDNKWDIFLMSQCKYNILSNSSFSWWSHYFNKNEGKKAIIPEYWINDIADSFPSVISSLQNLETEKSIINFPVVQEENPSPLFSIILTAYNQENCLRRAISSVLNQTLQNFELIIVDDCSTDGTVKLIEKYAALNKNVKLYRHHNNSSSHVARMTGVKNAKGKFILFLDGDDYFFIDALEKLKKEIIDQKEFDVCEFSYISRPDNSKTLAENNNVNPRIDYYKSSNYKVTIWNKLYKTELVKTAFCNMEEEYIRTGDDTYESICIAYYTKQFINADINVLNYVSVNGISLKKNDYNSNLIHAKSINKSLECLQKFFIKQNDEKLLSIYNNVENHFFNWFMSVINNNTIESDMIKSFCLIPKYFSYKYFEKKIRLLYTPAILKKKIKAVIKKIIPKWMKTILRK